MCSQNKQEDYDKYIAQQKKDAIDLTNESSPALIVAQYIFSQSPEQLPHNSAGLFIDADSMQIGDVFCFLLEVLLYGVNILTNRCATIFNLESMTDDIIVTIKGYMKMLGFSLTVEEFLDKPTNSYCTIYDDTAAIDFSSNSWVVLNYLIVQDPQIVRATQSNVPLSNFVAEFTNTRGSYFTIKFDFSSGKNIHI